jgi:hypothetical protein
MGDICKTRAAARSGCHASADPHAHTYLDFPFSCTDGPTIHHPSTPLHGSVTSSRPYQRRLHVFLNYSCLHRIQFWQIWQSTCAYRWSRYREHLVSGAKTPLRLICSKVRSCLRSSDIFAKRILGFSLYGSAMLVSKCRYPNRDALYSSQTEPCP